MMPCCAVGACCVLSQSIPELQRLLANTFLPFSCHLLAGFIFSMALPTVLCSLSQGIPELQQLLAYTAADVVHYAVGT
jgi:hypothetical protein